MMAAIAADAVSNSRDPLMNTFQMFLLIKNYQNSTISPKMLSGKGIFLRRNNRSRMQPSFRYVRRHGRFRTDS